ncbi:MAG: DNA methyltransferase [Kiritimatiellia bacterium]
MNPTQRREISRYLEAFDFSGLFTDPAIGWDWPEAGASLRIPFQTGFLTLDSVAEKRGVRILHVPPVTEGRIPDSAQRRSIERAVRPHAAEHLLIFTDAGRTRQIWQWNQRRPGRPSSLREITWQRGRANELLLQKLASIAFRLDEEDGLDITGVVRRLSDQLNRDQVTKRFYDQFKKEKDAFQKLITGIHDKAVQAHFTSLMLNRIMFCYFLQRKGFLDGDPDYLRNRLETVRDQIGEDRFHSFYRSFLRRLFHEGLGAPPDSREHDFSNLIGNIPYLNGGIFEEHPIERDHPSLTIPDPAFGRVFAFFDRYDWHLDDRPLAEGDEINPEILGYVFEKFTNQKEMGAYYTKEDITEYISKNCIIPFLIRNISEKIPDDVWDRLAENPDRYIHPAVRHGACDSPEAWEDSLPDNIRDGLRPETLHQPVQAGGTVRTLELRKDWNTPTPASHGLETEIWRETIARCQRCHELRARLRAGEIRQIDDFITYNLDIRQFAQDLVDQAAPSLLLAFFKALRGVSVLDPTCGSGAFLFAALEILQPLYQACLERMRAFLLDWESADERHPNWEREFKSILGHADAHPNEEYYIHKTIIVHNLYGVDIMEEAVEICKLRLFLKLAAQLEAGQPVEPLPDIDFNVRAGNTLVGYATRDEIRRAFTEEQGKGNASQGLLLGIENDPEDFTRLMELAEDADRAFQRFHQLQEELACPPETFREAKTALNEQLQTLRDQLDHFLAKDYDAKNIRSKKAFEKWLASHQPFHWFVEFYGIMNGGGFDVVIGNPPYVEISKVKSYKIPKILSTKDCGNLFAPVIERSCQISNTTSFKGMIVPITFTCTDRTATLRKFLKDQRCWASSFDMRPSSLFQGVAQRLTIFILTENNEKSLSSTSFQRWTTNFRKNLFETLNFIESKYISDSIAKMDSSVDKKLLEKKYNHKIATFCDTHSSEVYVHRIVRYFIKAFNEPPFFRNSGNDRIKSDDYKIYHFKPDVIHFVTCFINSSFFYWFWRLRGDGFHCGKHDILQTPLFKNISKDLNNMSYELLQILNTDRKKHTARKEIKSGKNTIQYDEFYISKSKCFLDKIDQLVASYSDMTEQELDYIINYDIKYRMGLTGSDGEGDEE